MTQRPPSVRYSNHKGLNDGDRFNIVVREIVGKRLTWDQLTGKLSESGGAPETIQGSERGPKKK